MLKRAVTLLVQTVVSGFKRRVTANDFSVVTEVDNLVQQEIQLDVEAYTQFCTSKFIQIRSSKPINIVMDNYTLSTRYFASILNSNISFTISNPNNELQLI